MNKYIEHRSHIEPSERKKDEAEDMKYVNSETEIKHPVSY